MVAITLQPQASLALKFRDCLMSEARIPRTLALGSSVSGNTRSETVRLAKRTELCGVLGRYWSSGLGGGFISAAPVQGAPDSGVCGPFL